MKSSIEVGELERGNAIGDGCGASPDVIIVYEWDVDSFHRKVSNLERQGYIARRETYRVTPEMNPETGQIVHLHTVEVNRALPQEATVRNSPAPVEADAETSTRTRV
jgi:hypothetical protein